MRKMRNAYNILIEKSEGKRLLGRPSHRWDTNIRLDLGEMEWEGVDYIRLTQDRYQWWDLVKTVMKFRIQ
jgi:hypothetical protein